MSALRAWFRRLFAPTITITRTVTRRNMTAEEAAAFDRAFTKMGEAFDELAAALKARTQDSSLAPDGGSGG